MTLNLMYSGNRAVFKGILTSVLSLVKFNPGPINVFILTMDLTDENPAYCPITAAQGTQIAAILQKTNPQSTCRVLDLTANYRQDGDLSYAKRFTPYALLRLYAADIPDLPDKILYLDTDTLVLAPLTDLFATDLTGYEFGACKDYFGHWFFGWRYCNSGVLLLNLPEIKKTHLMDKARQMCIEKNLFLSDQTALNKCAQNILILHPRYNRQRRIDPDTVIRHYCASWRFFPYIHLKTVKQWQTDKVLKDKHRVYNNAVVTQILQEYLALTPAD